MKRTEWAELHVEDFLSTPFITEFVFRSIQKLDPTQKEVADFLIMHKGSGILISQKAQEDPLSRSIEKNERWVRKKTKEAVSQLTGAIRAGHEKPIWCDHRRMGRVEFPGGLPSLLHGLVLIETWHPVDLHPDAEELPLDYLGTPITYLSLNDFLNMVQQLRTIPELLAYLDARRTIPLNSLRVIGEEKSLFEFYLWGQGTLNGCVGHSDAKLAVAVGREEFDRILRRKTEMDFYNEILEQVADALATRHPNYARDLSPELLAGFDADEDRRTYIRMQEVIADLRLSERAHLGRALFTSSEKLVDEPQGFVFRAAHFESRDWIFILCASKNVRRPEVLERMAKLMLGALAFYRKPNCMVIIERDWESYEVGLSKPGFQPTPLDHV